MVANAVRHRLTPNIALALAGAAGLCVALAGLVLPGDLLERLVLTSGVAAFVPAAEPPLGTTARICVGLFAGGLAALVAWFALSLLLAWSESRPARSEAGDGERRPTVRRADAHPDARPREPLRARDLAVPGDIAPIAEAEPDVRIADAAAAIALSVPDAPLPDEPVIAMGAPCDDRPIHAPPPEVQALPADLDQPLSAFDPAAIPPVPMAPPPPLRPLRRPTPPPPVFNAGERFEAFELAPAVPMPGAGPAAPGDGDAAPTAMALDPSVAALLERLERGMARRGVVEPVAATPVEPLRAAPDPAPDPACEPPRSLAETLAELRQLATRA